MRKSAPVACLLAGFLLLGGLFTASPAFADDDEDEDSSSEVVEVDDSPSEHPPKPSRAPRPEGEEKRKELEEKYGKKDRLSLPPLVIRPIRDTDDLEVEEADEDDEDDEDSTVAGSTVRQNPAPLGNGNSEVVGSLGIASAGFIAINPVSASNAGNTASGRAVNPEQSTPIDISQVNFSRKTPAEVFIQASQVGLYAMAVGAVALGLVAASRAIRRK